MDYIEVEDWLCNQLPFYYKEGQKAYKKDLTNIRLILNHLNNPQNNKRYIHVAGTNGKGSVCHMLSSILQESGYKVGLFSSPHILDFRERIKINGQKIKKDFIVKFVNKYFDFFKNKNFSFFEITTALSFKYFKENNVDIAIIECGLGGRLDSTNIIDPILSIITNVSMDHMSILGDNIQLIAHEKAGIIKKDTPVLTSEKKKNILKYFKDISKNRSAPFFTNMYLKSIKNFDNFSAFHIENISTARSAVDILNKMKFKISISSFNLGIKNLKKNTDLIGRWDIVNRKPLIILDIAHNQDAFEIINKELSNIKQKKHIILGFSSDKDLNNIFSKIKIDANFYFCASKNPRVLNPNDYLDKIISLGCNYKIFENSALAYDYIKSFITNDELVLVTGSAFIVSDVAINFR